MGKTLDDAKLVQDAKVDPAASKMQNAVGGVSEALHEAYKTSKE